MHKSNCQSLSIGRIAFGEMKEKDRNALLKQVLLETRTMPILIKILLHAKICSELRDFLTLSLILKES